MLLTSRNINPLAQVPAYIENTENGETKVITQSLAIMEYLQDKYPTQGTNILTDDIYQRAKVIDKFFIYLKTFTYYEIIFTFNTFTFLIPFHWI